ncbi:MULTISPECIES: NADH-ubiquinone oxidoreductase-F iron-sulfur binding region domain-containing protein [Methylomonas]|uniref:NADH-ubiquinone oxidoreductase-F iron-sulfur binding region domain-containing protein n=1 Tax=Methylomonas TaxID=416 RepID=UPI001232C5AA|nr:NADH-ubiquinone oxidoreductase-F iron-sulfur binding region domain-containing protein [Methylomonas rhizoryzae]
MRTFLQALLTKTQFQPVRLLTILRAVQAEFRHIPSSAVDILAEALQISRTQILAVAEFYSFLHLTPQGRYAVLFSDSITDRMLDQQNLLHYAAKRWNVAIGEVRADGMVSLHTTSCTGLCDQGPAALINGIAIANLNRPKIDLIAELIERQAPLAQWPASLFAVNDNLYKAGLLLKSSLDSGAAIRAACAHDRAEVFSELERSGLRGRGGAGFKTALKWRYCAEEVSDRHYVVCNADEGEPGTFKDRVLLNSFADQVFEGMTVCAFLIGARQGFLYLRAEYEFLHSKLEAVLERRRQAGLLGNNILNKAFDFDIEIRLGAGAYICGEESALIESLEGKPGIPRNRPPYPVSSGYLQKPTVVNNVETFLAAAQIVVRGADWFNVQGTEKSPGSKILSVSGDCLRPGIYEYPFGTPVRQILNDCGARDVLGVQVGGPSGTFISNRELGRCLAFEDLPTGGSFIVFDNSRNILQITQNFIHFFAHESCGFCTPCRVGTSLLKQQLDKIVEGHGSAGDVAELESLCRLVKQYSHCGLGQTAANPILSTLQRYPDVYQAQLKRISYEPGFDLDGALAVARRMANRDDAAAHLSQVEE